ncbi:MAG: hypothetical protein DMF66_04115 [Acidobacteria bacterium]|nr:MAG: hypothetical protein DMF66_04115 [Acidobacteriota bacterium]
MAGQARRRALQASTRARREVRGCSFRPGRRGAAVRREGLAAGQLLLARRCRGGGDEHGLLAPGARDFVRVGRACRGVEPLHALGRRRVAHGDGRGRAAQVFDFVGVGVDGRVFAVDGASGISLWTARFNQTPPASSAAATGGKSNSLAPLVLTAAQKPTEIVVATQNGVRALRGETGREDWRANVEGRITGGVAADMSGDGSTEVVLVTEDPAKFYVLNGSSGRILAEQKLDGSTSGAPYPFAAGGARGVFLGMKKGRVEFRGADGNLISEGKLDGEVTTPPVVVAHGQTPFLAVGTDNGLWAFSVPDLKPLGVIKAEDDAVRGTLAVADVDGDGAPEIAMVTKRGRVALVNTTDGNVRWSTEGATDAASATFADVNSDGVLDVIVPGGKDFALAFSGRDGSLVMKVVEGGKQVEGQKAGAVLRSLVITPSAGGGLMLVGGDPAGVGLRAVELPKGAYKASSK